MNEIDEDKRNEQKKKKNRHTIWIALVSERQNGNRRKWIEPNDIANKMDRISEQEIDGWPERSESFAAERLSWRKIWIKTGKW